MSVLVHSAIKKVIHEEGKQCTSEFLSLLEFFVVKKVREACKVHNGGATRLDASVAGYVGIK